MTSLEKKKRNNIIIMVSAVVVLAALLIVLKLTNMEEEVQTNTVSYPLTKLLAAQITGVTYDYSDGSHASYKYADSTWYNADDEQFPLSSEGFAKQFVEQFVTITSTRKITEFEGGLKALGLDNPEMTLQITGTDGVTTTYKMGKYNPTLDEYYIMINDDEDSIYTVNDDILYICRKDIYDYASIDSFPTYSLTTLDYLQFTSYGNSIRLLYREDGMEEDITGYGWKWFFSTPFTRPMPCESSKMETMTEDELPELEYTKTVNYKATAEELAEYGLDDPAGSYTICYNETDEDGKVTAREVTVYIGKVSEEEGGYYTREVRREGLAGTPSNVVRILSTTGAELILGMNPLDYIVTNVTFLALEDIDGTTATFTTGEGEYTFSYDSAGTKVYEDDTYKMGETVIDSNKFTNLWLQMVSIKAERILYDKSDVKEGDAVYTIFADRNKDDYYGDITVKYIVYDSNYYQVEINGVTDVLMRRREVDSFFQNLIEFANTVEN